MIHLLLENATIMNKHFCSPYQKNILIHILVCTILACSILLLIFGLSTYALAQQTNLRKGTGLPVPRYVSLKSSAVNVREGPSNGHSVKYIYKRKGLPVEIIAEYDNWRRIRDSEGNDGWVWHSLLSGRRTALILPSKEHPDSLIGVYKKPDILSNIIAQLQPKVIIATDYCDGNWCSIEVIFQKKKYKGYIVQGNLWGVYPGEQFD